MQIDRLPGLYYKENVTYELSGVGSKIPIFIGVTGNTGTETHKVDGTGVLKYTKKAQVFDSVANGGIGKYYDEDEAILNANNKLAKVIYDFYDEARLINSGDIGVPYIYVIDIGTGANYEHWKNALKTAKSLRDASVEVYVGASITGTTTKSVVLPCSVDEQAVKLIDFMNIVENGLTPVSTDDYDDYGLRGCASNLDLRYAFTSFESATLDTKGNPTTYKDDDVLLKNLTTASGSNISYSRIGVIEPLLFGKTIARICCTPNNTEPGYYTYRSVEPGVFHTRTKAEMLELQNAGIIFNSDEHINDKVYPKINLCVSSSFSENPRPADSMFHARFNADALLRDVFESCYSQIKANESATNIAYLQTRVNKLVNDRVVSEEMVKWNDKTGLGTKLIVTNSDEDPYRLVVSGQIHPIKCTIAILINATVVI